jgi:hypothetical protein
MATFKFIPFMFISQHLFIYVSAFYYHGLRFLTHSVGFHGSDFASGSPIKLIPVSFFLLLLLLLFETGLCTPGWP